MTEADIALKYAVDFDSDKAEYNDIDALRTLAAEVRRLRAGIERVRALPRKCRNDEFAGGILDRDDVLAALEGE